MDGNIPSIEYIYIYYYSKSYIQLVMFMVILYHLPIFHIQHMVILFRNHPYSY